MKKNEKFLALLLSVVMILTCFVGTVTVNAENATPTATIVVTADAVEVGATEIPVTLTVTSETGINEALIKVSSDLGDIIAQPTVEANTPADADNTEGAANYNAFYLSARNVDDGTGNTTLGAITTATIKVVFTRTEAIVAGTYNVDVEIPEGKVIAASKDEVAIDLVCDGLEIVVEEPVVEPDVDLTFRVKNASMVLAGEILMNFNVMPYELDKTNVCTTFDVDGVKEFGILVWLADEYDANNIEYDVDHAYPYTDGPITADGYGVRFPLNSKQLNVTLYSRAYVILDNGDILYGKAVNGTDQIINYSAVKYVQSQLNRADTSTAIKDVLKAMLNYGSVAEIYFAKSGGYAIPTADKLPNNILSEADKVIPTAEYGSDLKAGQALDGLDGMESVQVETSRIRNSSLVLDQAVYLNYTVDLTTETAKTISSVKVLSWSEADYQAAVANGGKAVLGTETMINDCELQSGKSYRGKSYGIASNKLRDDVRARAYVEYTDGSVGYTRIFTYSAEYHAKSQNDKTDAQVMPELKAVFNALMIYADKAIVAFG